MMSKKVFKEVKNIILNSRYAIDLTRDVDSIRADFVMIKDWTRLTYLWGKYLSEDFIIEFQDQIDWYYLCTTKRQFTERFLRRFKYRVYFRFIYKNQKLSNKFIEDLKDRLMPHIIEEYEAI